MVLREAMIPVTAGLLAGLLAAAATNRILQAQLVGVSPYDALTMIGGAVVLVVIALAGCAWPARQATSVEPVIALRHD